MKTLLATTILAAIAAVASGVETQQTNNAARVNERIRSGLKQLGYPFVRLSGYGYTEKHWPLKQLCGKDSEFIDEKNRRDCLMMSFIAAVHDRDAPFAACVLLRIRREVKMFSAQAEEKLVEKAFSSARFVSDYGESLFRETFDEEIKGVVSPDGYTRARMRTIRLAPFVLRPSTTLADAVQVLNKKALAADYVNNRKGVKIVLNADGEVPELPYVKVGEYEYGNAGVTLESAVKIVAEAVGYTFEICKDGTVVVFKGSRRGSDG